MDEATSEPIDPQFTPGNTESSSIYDSEEYVPRIQAVNPRILRDIETRQTCEFNAFLKALLKRCLGDSCELELDEVLQKCLESVVDLCNGDQSEQLRTYLVEYCRPITRKKRCYPPFVKLCNHALGSLSSLTNIPLSPLATTDEQRLLFHISGPNDVDCRHGSCRPNVMLVDGNAVKNAAYEGNEHKTGKNISMEKAASLPRKAFCWNASRLACGFERPYTTINADVPLLYKPHARQEMSSITTSEDIVDAQESTLSRSVDFLMEPVPGAYTEQVPISTSNQTRQSSISNMASKVKGPNTPTSNSEAVQPGSTEARRCPSRGLSSQVAVGSKRPLESQVQGAANKRIRFNDELEPSLYLNARTALYGVEHLAHVPFSASVMAIAVVDYVVYLWWYDRQGAIQSSGLDFIRDLPHFMVLLLILQRLPETGWGQIPFLESSLIMPGTYGDINLKLGRCLKRAWGIRGRATTIFEAIPIALPPKIPPLLREQLEADGMVAKLSWGKSSQMLESRVIEEIQTRKNTVTLEEWAAVEGHIPDLIASKVFEDHSTSKIREDLGIRVDQVGDRVLILSVFRKLMPITDLEGEEFLRAWWDCVLCHRVLWKMGIHHRDISVGNLMYYNHNGRIMGALNDFDLSTLVTSDGEEHPTGTDRTGTLPFMARDLLAPRVLQGQVKHLYRHDFESFLWVLTWVAHRYQGGKEILNPPFDDWPIDFEGCRASKTSLLVDLITRKKLPPATSSYENTWMHFGKVLMKAMIQDELLEQSVPESAVDPYFELMKQALDASPFDLCINPLLQAGLGE